MINIVTRFGIGIDFEHSDGTPLVFEDEDEEKLFLVSFVGLVIKVPFLTCYIGDYYEVADE